MPPRAGNTQPSRSGRVLGLSIVIERQTAPPEHELTSDRTFRPKLETVIAVKIDLVSATYLVWNLINQATKPITWFI